jgi:hypothetical protein
LLKTFERLRLLKASEDSPNQEYIQNLIDDEITKLKDLIEIISSFENESFLIKEMNKLNKFVN